MSGRGSHRSAWRRMLLGSRQPRGVAPIKPDMLRGWLSDELTRQAHAQSEAGMDGIVDREPGGKLLQGEGHFPKRSV